MQKLNYYHIVVMPCMLGLFSSQSMALGLGNLDVRSSLGEPLIAKVGLYDASSKVAEDCFTFQLQTENGEVKLAADVQLKKASAEAMHLWIHGMQVINDPIVELTVQYHCEEQLSRHYTVLLDPPIDGFSSAASLANVSPSSGQGGAPQSMVSTTAPNHAETHKPRPSSSAKRNRSSSSPPRQEKHRAPNAPSVASEMLSRKADSSASQSVPLQGPKLIVSGESSAGEVGAVALRFERTMSDAPPADTPVGNLKLNDLSDDMTAMSNKLKYLESQLQVLQKRNQFLESRQTPPPLAKGPTPETSEASATWSVYLLYGTLTLAMAGLIATWVKRRKNTYLELDDDDSLFDLDKDEEEKSSDELNFDASIAATARQVASSNTSSAKSGPSLRSDPPDITEVNEGILEQAEVFVAHGRTQLAITLLQDHLHDHPTSSPAPWLLLLSLLKREKMRDEYQAATKGCRNYFNFFIPDFDDPVIPDNSSLEDYPNARDKVVQAWGSPEAVPLLDDLIFNRRNEARQGFDRSAYIDILLLRSIAQSVGLNDINSIAHENAEQVASPSEETAPEIATSNENASPQPQAPSAPFITPLDEPEPEQVAIEASQHDFADAPSVEPSSDQYDFTVPALSSPEAMTDVSSNVEHASAPDSTQDLLATQDDNTMEFTIDWPTEPSLDDAMENTELIETDLSFDPIAESLIPNEHASLNLEHSELESAEPTKRGRKKTSSVAKDDKSKPLDFDLDA